MFDNYLMFPIKDPQAKKGDGGKVLVIGGSANIHGAPLLTALGALASGVDLVKIFLPKNHVEAAKNKHTHFLVEGFSGDTFSPTDAKKAAEIANGWADSVVIGCGFFTEEMPAVYAFLSEYSGNIVLDAGALQPSILKVIAKRENLLITPHSGEFERIFGIPATKATVIDMSKKYGITILKKGPVDLIASSGEFYKNETGSPEMIVGGTGDALAGICGGFLAQNFSPLNTAVFAAKTWGQAGEKMSKTHRAFFTEEMIDIYKRR